MSIEAEVYQAPRTVAYAWRLLFCAAVVIVLQLVPVGYAVATAVDWVPLATEAANLSFEPTDLGVVQRDDLLVMVELAGLAVIVTLAALGVRRGRDWGRVLVPAVTAFVLLACPVTDANRLDSEVPWSDPPIPVWLVAYAFLLAYPLLIAASVLVLLRGSRRHFVPR